MIDCSLETLNPIRMVKCTMPLFTLGRTTLEQDTMAELKAPSLKNRTIEKRKTKIAGVDNPWQNTHPLWGAFIVGFLILSAFFSEDFPYLGT